MNSDTKHVVMMCDGMKTRAHTSFLASYIVFMCFRADNELVQAIVSVLSAATMIVFYLFGHAVTKAKDEALNESKS